MDEKDPTSYGVFTYLMVTAFAAWGGLVSFLRRRHDASNFLWAKDLAKDLISSAFVGIITFLLCEAAHINPLITAALVGISGHMGSRALFIIEMWAKTKLPYRGPLD